MNKDQCTQIIENALSRRDINPLEARTEGDGEWLLYTNDHEVYLDVWQEDGPNVWNFNTENPPAVFQTIGVISRLPEENMEEFMEELLHMNFNLFDCSFCVNTEENMLVVKHKSLSFGLTEDFVGLVIDSIGYYTQLAIKALGEKYNLEKIIIE
jgi:hypothetical protein